MIIPVECTTCNEVFKTWAEMDKHNPKHKQVRQVKKWPFTDGFEKVKGKNYEVWRPND